MTQWKDKDHRVDEMVRRALKDDISPELDQRMKQQMAAFSKRFMALEEATGYTFLPWFRIDWHNSILGKLAFCFAAFALLFLSAFLQMSGPKSSFATVIGAIRSAAITINAIEDTVSMICSIQVREDNEKGVTHTIYRTSPDVARIDFGNAEESIHETWWMRNGQTTILNHKTPYTTITSFHRLVSSLATVDDLTSHLEEPWQELEQEKMLGENLSSYCIQNHHERSRLEIVIDDQSHLPREMVYTVQKEKKFESPITLELHFQWNTPIDSAFMDPPHAGKEERD